VLHALQRVACQPLHVVLVCKGGARLAHLQLRASTTHRSQFGAARLRRSSCCSSQCTSGVTSASKGDFTQRCSIVNKPARPTS
jgi:hypothetical protein